MSLNWAQPQDQLRDAVRLQLQKRGEVTKEILEPLVDAVLKVLNQKSPVFNMRSAHVYVLDFIQANPKIIDQAKEQIQQGAEELALSPVSTGLAPFIPNKG